MKRVLTIAGSDCSGGAGIQADLKTFSAHGTFGMSVITSVVAENTCKVISVHNVPKNIIEDQLDAVFTDIEVDAVKVGMLNDETVMKTVAGKLKEYKPKYVVVDPVMIAKGGCALMEESALDTMKEIVIPSASLLTPNIPEAETITGITIDNEEDMKKACRVISEMGSVAVLIKGGHAIGEPVDILYSEGAFFVFKGNRIDSVHTHGTGCTLSSAITANLANGYLVEEAVRMAKEYVTNAILYAVPIGYGHGPTNHFYFMEKYAP